MSNPDPDPPARPGAAGGALPAAADWLELGLAALPAAQAQRIRLLRSLLASAGRLRQRLDRALAPAGITSQQAGLLQFIEAQARPPTQGQVAQALGMTHQNVKQIALALERKGFLVIEADAADRRARRLVLTPHHQHFWQARNPGDFVRVEGWTAVLSDAEVGQLVALLQRLRAGLGDAGDCPDEDPALPGAAAAPRRRTGRSPRSA